MATQFSVQDNKLWKTTFFTIWSGQALSILGRQLVQFALIWYLTVQTSSATVPTSASLVGMLPMQGILSIAVITALFAMLPLVFVHAPQPDRNREAIPCSKLAGASSKRFNQIIR